jgi:hypothetical protein
MKGDKFYDTLRSLVEAKPDGAFWLCHPMVRSLLFYLGTSQGEVRAADAVDLAQYRTAHPEDFTLLGLPGWVSPRVDGVLLMRKDGKPLVALPSMKLVTTLDDEIVLVMERRNPGFRRRFLDGGGFIGRDLTAFDAPLPSAHGVITDIVVPDG